MVVDVVYIRRGLFSLNNFVEGFLRPTSTAPPMFHRAIDLSWAATAVTFCCMCASYILPRKQMACALLWHPTFRPLVRQSASRGNRAMQISVVSWPWILVHQPDQVVVLRLFTKHAIDLPSQVRDEGGNVRWELQIEWRKYDWNAVYLQG